jgi:hypothetical protein
VEYNGNTSNKLPNTVIINGQKVTEFTGSRLTEGYIGLQAHDDESKVSFRNIMIKEVKS